MVKKILIYSSSQDANAGGGLAYVIALAKGLRTLGHRVTIRLHGTFPVKGLSSRYDLEGFMIETDARFNRIDFLKQLRLALRERMVYDAVFYHANRPPKINLINESYLLCDFPLTKALGLKDRIKLKTWKGIIVNSRFTAKNVKRFWGRKSTVLNPPVVRPSERPTNKNGHFLSIGRFIGTGRSKRQDAIIEAYKAASLQRRLPPLHLAGFVQDLDYLKRLEKQALGHTVYFHKNIDRHSLDTLLRECSILVHACGLGVEEQKDPELTEHYGIAIVEAMAHGCVPLVVPKGGPRTLVNDGRNGRYWNSVEELKVLLMEYAQDDEPFTSLAEAALEDSHTYDFERFNDELAKIFM